MEASDVIIHPLLSEKSMRLIDENTIVLLVSEKAKKADIASAVSELYGKKVKNVRTVKTVLNRKKAYVTLIEKNAAADVAAKLGML